MAYTAEISRANPTCFVFLIDQSGSMQDAIGGGEALQRKCDVVADALNRLLSELVIKCANWQWRHADVPSDCPRPVDHRGVAQ